jgi:hypothetical protein
MKRGIGAACLFGTVSGMALLGAGFAASAQTIVPPVVTVSPPTVSAPLPTQATQPAATTPVRSATTLAQTPASDDPLVRLLVTNGVITPAQASGIGAAPTGPQRDELIRVLLKNGAITQQQVNSLPPPSAPAPVSYAASGTAPPMPQSPPGSPLAIRAGNATFTPGGFIDMTAVGRSTNVGSGIGTNFGTIPEENTIPGRISETRLSAQQSQVSLRFDDTMFGDKVLGYVEGDFLGNDAANVFITTNSHTFRLRHAYTDWMHGPWEFLGGQTWSLLTPNRVGLSPEDKDVFYSLNVDPSYMPGLVYTRAAQGRVIYHPNANWAIGLAVENPEQSVGAGEVIFPFAFNAVAGLQFDAANQTTIPNKTPDFIGKVAYDSNPVGRNFHVEAAALLREFQTTNVVIGSTGFHYHNATGFGAAINADLEPFNGFHLIGNAFWSNGGGRYIGGLGPDVVIRPNGSATDFSIKTVESMSTVIGPEWHVTPNTTLAAYWSATFFRRNSFIDTTSPLLNKPTIGFGGVNSPISANKTIYELSADWWQTWYRSQQFGAVQTGLQLSYLQREPWFVFDGAPILADSFMGFLSFRYILP